MRTEAGRGLRNALTTGRGFSLVELLLAVSLILLLLGAVAFNFSSVQRGAELDEGATQLESLIRYARAHASNSGRKVRITFEEDAGDGLLVPMGNLEVVWEPDPLGLPGHFQKLHETDQLVTSILDVISIEDVRPLTAGSAPETAGLPGDPALPAFDDADEFGFSPITFHPDGSSDSAEITIAARNGEDARRMVIRLVGLTGSIRRTTLVEENPLDQELGSPATSPDGEAGPAQ